MMSDERKAVVDALVNALNAKEYPDSIEVGTPAKGGALKVYGNADRPEEFANRIAVMVSLREKAGEQLSLVDEARARARKDFVV